MTPDQDRNSIPGAFYGKDPSLSGKVAQGYCWLRKDSRFPDAALACADAWIQKFQWKPLQSAVHPPVGLLTLLPSASGGLLLLRFVDAGPDDQGRSHMLALEAAWVSPAVLRGAPALPGQLLVRAVEDRPLLPGAASSINLVEISKFDAPSNVAKAITVPRDVVVVADETTFELGLRPNTLVLDSVSWKEREFLDSSRAARPIPPKKPAVVTGTTLYPSTIPRAASFTKHWLPGVLAIALLVSITAFGWMWQRKEAEIEISRGEVRKKIDEIGKKDTRISDLEEKIRNLEGDKEEFENKNALLIKERDDARKQITEYKDNADQALNTENSNLKSENEQLRNAIKSINDVLSALHSASPAPQPGPTSPDVVDGSTEAGSDTQ